MAPRAPRECTETKCEAPVTKLAVTLISWSGDGRSSRHDRSIPRQDRDKSVGAGGISLGDARKTEGDACSRREHRGNVPHDRGNVRHDRDNVGRHPDWLVRRRPHLLTRPTLHTTRPRLRRTRPRLCTTRPRLRTTRPRLHMTRPRLRMTRPRLHMTRPRLHTTRPRLRRAQDLLRAPTSEFRARRVLVNTGAHRRAPSGAPRPAPRVPRHASRAPHDYRATITSHLLPRQNASGSRCQAA